MVVIGPHSPVLVTAAVIPPCAHDARYHDDILYTAELIPLQSEYFCNSFCDPIWFADCQ